MTAKPVVLWALVAGLAASVAFGVRVERDKRALAGTVAQLNQHLTKAQDTIATQATQLASLQGDLSALQAKLTDVQQEVARLQTEQLGFREANDRLSRNVSDLASDNEAMRARLASITELKAAIRTVKAQIRAERWGQWLARLDAQRMSDHRRLAQGNLGYLVRGGASTMASATSTRTTATMQVRVLEPQLE